MGRVSSPRCVPKEGHRRRPRSAAIRVMEILNAEAAAAEYRGAPGPAGSLANPIFASNGNHDTLRSVSLDPERLRKADCVVILVAHTSVDYGAVMQGTARVFDAVNATRGRDGHAQVERL